MIELKCLTFRWQQLSWRLWSKFLCLIKYHKQINRTATRRILIILIEVYSRHFPSLIFDATFSWCRNIVCTKMLRRTDFPGRSWNSSACMALLWFPCSKESMNRSKQNIKGRKKEERKWCQKVEVIVLPSIDPLKIHHGLGYSDKILKKVPQTWCVRDNVLARGRHDFGPHKQPRLMAW